MPPPAWLRLDGAWSRDPLWVMDTVVAPDEPDSPGHLDPYDHATVEARWRRIWDARGDYRTELDEPVRPFYNLMMFPYPSAEGLHVGHIIPFAGGDIYGRWRRLMGDTVFEPMGFDAFGIHSENYAMKIGEHPAVVMRRAVNNFRENQLGRIGAMFDWSHQVNPADPAYYRWTSGCSSSCSTRGSSSGARAPSTGARR